MAANSNGLMVKFSTFISLTLPFFLKLKIRLHVPGNSGVKCLGSRISVRWPSCSISILASSNPVAKVMPSSRFTSLSTSSNCCREDKPKMASSVTVMSRLAVFPAWFSTKRVSVHFSVSFEPKKNDLPLKVRYTVFTFEFGDVHHATFSPPMSSELSFCSTTAPPKTFTSPIPTVMVGAPGCTTGGVGVGVGEGLSSSPPPQEDSKVTDVHANNKHTVARNAATRLFTTVPTGCFLAVAVGCGKS